MKQDQQKIHTLLLEYQNACNSSDAKAVSALYHPESVLLPGDMPTAVGLEAIEGFYTYAFSLLELKLNFDINLDDIIIDGDFAYATTSSTGTRRIKETGDVIPEVNRELWIFKINEGEWSIARYMFNKSDEMRAEL